MRRSCNRRLPGSSVQADTRRSLARRRRQSAWPGRPRRDARPTLQDPEGTEVELVLASDHDELDDDDRDRLHAALARAEAQHAQGLGTSADEVLASLRRVRQGDACDDLGRLRRRVVRGARAGLVAVLVTECWQDEVVSPVPLMQAKRGWWAGTLDRAKVRE
jgi:hypothetical protein